MILVAGPVLLLLLLMFLAPICVDGVTGIVLLAVHLGMLLRCKRAAVRLPVGVNLPIDCALLSFQARRLSGPQLARRGSICNPRLLVEASAIHGVHGSDGGAAVVGGNQLTAILTGRVFVRKLIRRCLKVLLAHVGSLLIVRSGIHAPRPVEAGARVVVDDGGVIDGGVVDYRAIHVSVVDHGGVDVSHGGFITIRAPRPPPAIETDTAETETIVDTAVES